MVALPCPQTDGHDNGKDDSGVPKSGESALGNLSQEIPATITRVDDAVRSQNKDGDKEKGDAMSFLVKVGDNSNDRKMSRSFRRASHCSPGYLCQSQSMDLQKKVGVRWNMLLVCGLAAFLLGSCRPDPVVEEVKENTATGDAVAVPVVTDWPLSRGGAGLSGQAGVPLPVEPEVKWTFKTTGSIMGETVVSQGTAVFGDTAGFLTAVDVATGEKKWQKEFEQSFEAAPAIFEDTIYIGCEDTFFYALELETGEEKWSLETNDKITAAVNLTKSPDGSEMWVILNGYDGVCRALRASNGEEVWVHETASPINGTPAIVDGKFIVFGGCDEFLYSLDLATGKAVKQIKGEAPIVSTVGTEGTFVAWGNHANQVLGADINADEPSWIYSDRAFPFMSAPAIDLERVYVGGRDKKIHAISRDKGKRVWTFKTGSRVESSPLLFSDGLLVGSSDGRLYALTLDEGQEIWTLDLGESLIANASFANGMILIGSEDGTLFAISGN